MMVPATGIAVAGAKLSVTDTDTLPATRSRESMANASDVTACAVECERKSMRIMA